jgi:hypothetical protein
MYQKLSECKKKFWSNDAQFVHCSFKVCLRELLVSLSHFKKSKIFQSLMLKHKQRKTVVRADTLCAYCAPAPSHTHVHTRNTQTRTHIHECAINNAKSKLTAETKRLLFKSKLAPVVFLSVESKFDIEKISVKKMLI